MESTSKTKSDLKGRGSGEKYLQHKIKNYSKPTAIFKIKFISCGLKSICPFKKLATFLSLRNQSDSKWSICFSVSVLKQKTHNSCSVPEYEKDKQQQSVREDMMSNGNQLLFVLETK